MIKICLQLLFGLLLFACFFPVYSLLVIFPVTFVFGDSTVLFAVEYVAVSILSAVTAFWVVRRSTNQNRRTSTGAKASDEAGRS